MATLMEYLTRAVQEEASDLFIVPGAPVSIKLDGQLCPIGEEKIKAAEGEGLIWEIYSLAQREMEPFLRTGDDDFSFSVAGLARFRVNTYKQRGSCAAVIRVVAFDIPDWQELHIPEQRFPEKILFPGKIQIRHLHRYRREEYQAQT